MTYTDTYTPRTTSSENWFVRSQNWLDARGKGAWIALLILSLVTMPLVGFALLAYMIWSKRLFSSSSNRFSRKIHTSFAVNRPTGNAAFDAYKADTLRRLEEEQGSFESFLERLRAAKDKSEFDTFMDERATRKDGSADA